MDAIELNMSKTLDDIRWGQTTPEMGANDPFSVRMEGGVECGWVERWSGVGYEVVEGLCCARSGSGSETIFRTE